MKKFFNLIRDFEFTDYNGCDSFKESFIENYFKDYPKLSRIILFFLKRSDFSIIEHYVCGKTYKSLDDLVKNDPLDLRKKYRFTAAFKYSDKADRLWVRI